MTSPCSQPNSVRVPLSVCRLQRLTDCTPCSAAAADKDFPSSFDAHVKKIIRLLFNVLAHLYHGHFREIVLLNLHSHLNCLFSHLVLFNDQFKLVDEKEAELLVDDVYQVNISQLQSRGQGMDVDVGKEEESK